MARYGEKKNELNKMPEDEVEPLGDNRESDNIDATSKEEKSKK